MGARPPCPAQLATLQDLNPRHGRARDCTKPFLKEPRVNKRDPTRACKGKKGVGVGGRRVVLRQKASSSSFSTAAVFVGQPIQTLADQKERRRLAGATTRTVLSAQSLDADGVSCVVCPSPAPCLPVSSARHGLPT